MTNPPSHDARSLIPPDLRGGSPGSEIGAGFIAPRRRMLAVGAVSRNAVDSAIEVAYECGTPIMLIASRSQVDHDAQPPGYVAGWSTAALAEYVHQRDPAHLVLLCRDHGGPWQHPAELAAGLDEHAALDSALASFKADIDAGFNIIHIDTSIDATSGLATPDAAVARLLILYDQVLNYARMTHRLVTFEIGFENQRPEIAEPQSFARQLGQILGCLARAGLQRPQYVVAQTGTKVVEMRNVGVVAHNDNLREVGQQLRQLVAVCDAYAVGLKAHNCDYLDEQSWTVLAKASIGGVNVAPEYGVVETMAFLQLLAEKRLYEERDEFLRLSYESRRWAKWMGSPTSCSVYERAVMAGHYVFATPDVEHIRRQAGLHLAGGMDELNNRLRAAIRRVMGRHVRLLNPG